jgi:hypothetical protein
MLLNIYTIYTRPLSAQGSTVVAYCCRLYLATGCLSRICLRGDVFIEQLPSNGSIRHNIKMVLRERGWGAMG